MPRVLYGVQGEGRGHATRSLRVIEALIREGHEVLVLTGGDARPLLEGALGNRARTFLVPLLRYAYAPRGELSPWRTVATNAIPLMRMALGDARLEAAVRAFRPDAVVSDFEPVSCRLARKFRLPVLAIDHQHFLTEARLPKLNGLPNLLKLCAYRLGVHMLSGWPRRVLVSSFHHFPKKPSSRARFIGPFLPEELDKLANRDDGHVTAYIKRPGHLARLIPVCAAVPERRFEIFSAWEREWAEPLPRNVVLRPVSRSAFLNSLASCHALIATAGNQVLAEAIRLGKPVVAIPEPGVLEQAFNARALEESGCGMACGAEDFDVGVWDWFEGGRPGYLRRLMEFRAEHPDYDGLTAAMEAIREMLAVENSEVRDRESDRRHTRKEPKVHNITASQQ